MGPACAPPGKRSGKPWPGFSRRPGSRTPVCRRRRCFRIQVYTDHIRLHAETARGGISEAQYGIAELGTLVQCRDSADERIAATMSEVYVGVVPGSEIVETYDDMFDLLSGLDPIPNFVGFITGPSRTADIECVSTVGVHGPIQLFAVVVDDA